MNYLPRIQIPTAAAVSLIIQTLSNYVFASKNPLGFEFDGGGTHVSYSPNFDVLLHVNKPLFELFGLRLHIQLQKPGFYPQGGAKGKIFMEPLSSQLINLISGKVRLVEVISSASSKLRNQKAAELQIYGFKSIYKGTIKQFAGYADSINPGFACSAILKYEGNSIKGVARIGDKNTSPEENGKLTAMDTLKELENPASVDEQLADQLILPLCFAPKGSSYTFDKLYPHVKTNLKVIKVFFGDILSLEKLENNIYQLTRI